jgi:hypothetical protein
MRAVVIGINPRAVSDQEILQATMNTSHVTRTNQAASNAGLVRHDDEGIAGLAQEAERGCDVGQKLNVRWIAVVWTIDDQRAIAVEKDDRNRIPTWSVWWTGPTRAASRGSHRGDTRPCTLVETIVPAGGPEIGAYFVR